MFQESLKQTLQHVQGARACMLIGFDGIPIASVFADEVQDVDAVNVVAVELSGMFGKLKNTAVGSAGLHEVSLSAGEVSVVARVIQEEYLLLMTLTPDADLARGARMLRLIAPWVEQQM